MPAIENRQANIWWGKQSAKGSPVSLPAGMFRQGRFVSGDILPQRTDANENYADGNRFNNATDFVQQIVGNGNPTLQGSSGVVGHLAYLMLGQETVTGGTDALFTLTVTGVPTGGSFVLNIIDAGGTVYPLTVPFNSTSAALQAQILALTNLFNPGEVVCAGGPLPGTGITITFANRLAKTQVTPPTLGTNALTGGTTPAPAIATTAAGSSYQHVATPANAGSFWTGWAKKVGQTVGPLRQRFDDCKFTSLRVEASSQSKIVHVTPTFTSISNVGQTFAGASDPSAGQELYNEPMLYTEGEGRFNINGTVYSGHSSYALQINDNVTPFYGDSVYPFDVTYGLGEIVLENVTILVDQNGLNFYNQQIYGSTSPAAGTNPTKTVPLLGSYVADLRRGYNNSRGIKIEVLGVKWAPDLAIPANPDGGAVELTLAGSARVDVAGDPMVRVTTQSADPAYP